MKLKVIDVVNKNAYYFRNNRWDRLYKGLYINGEKVDETLLEIGFTFSKDDSVGYMPSSKELLHYEKDGKILSVDEYNAMPTYYDSDTPDEDVLVCISNRKKLEGYNPVYKELTIQPYELEVIGSIESTGSDFILPSVSSQTMASVYLIDANNASLDEYNKLSKKYSSIAVFEEPNRGYLRFTKVNKEYPFDNCYPFNERPSPVVFDNLDDARKEENSIRSKVRERVMKCIGNLSNEKKVSIISYLKNTKRAKTRRAMIDMIDILIDDLSEFKDEFKL
ncbi:MAG: hypothetical protein ACRC9P_02000 [Bacteroides sp.]